MLTEEKQHKFNIQIQISRMLVPTSQNDFHLRITDNAVSPQLLQILITIYTTYFVLHSTSAFTLQIDFSKHRIFQNIAGNIMFLMES